MFMLVKPVYVILCIKYPLELNSPSQGYGIYWYTSSARSEKISIYICTNKSLQELAAKMMQKSSKCLQST